MLGYPLPPDSQRPEVVVPAVGSLDDPAASLLAADRSGERRLASTPDVRFDVAFLRVALRLRVVVSLVEAEIVRHSPSIGSAQDDRVERTSDHVHVMDVGARQRDAERNTSSIRQYMAFRAEFRAIRGVGPSEPPPFGAFTETLSREAHAQSMPTCSS